MGDLIATGLAPLDTALGGGLPSGGLVILAGEAGVGKTTLALQLAALRACERPAFYLTSDPTARVGAYLRRMGLEGAPHLAARTIRGHGPDEVADVALDARGAQLVVVDDLYGAAATIHAGRAYPGSLADYGAAIRVAARDARTDTRCVVMVVQTVGDRRPKIDAKIGLEIEADLVLTLAGRGGRSRWVSVVKNRYGACAVAAELVLTDAGFA